MRILVENSGYHLRNLGDVAMLQGAVERLRQLGPDLEIRVICSDPDRLQELIPDCEPLSNHLSQRSVAERLSLLPHRLFPRGLREQRIARDRHQRILRPDRLMARLRHSRDPASRSWLAEVEAADAVLATGGGFLTDSFEAHALGVLTTLRLAQACGKPTALLGQGLGPILRPSLKEVVAAVLRNASLLTLREGVLGPSVLVDMGLQANPEWVVAGDDALELVPSRMAAGRVNRIGVTLRLSAYAGFHRSAQENLRRQLQDLRSGEGEELEFCPLPIDLLNAESNDETAALHMLHGFLLVPDYDTPKTPSDIVERAQSCRVTLSGSYHSALFSIAQGVPVIAVQASSYYRGKFAGLEAMFPGSVQVYDAGAAESGDLQRCLHAALAVAEPLRQAWVETASHYRSLGREQYVRWLQSIPSTETSTHP